MKEYLYFLANVFLLIGLIRVIRSNQRLPKRKPRSLTEGILFGFQDLDKIVRVALPWWGAAILAALISGLI